MKRALSLILVLLLLTHCNRQTESSTEEIILKFSTGKTFCQGTHKVSARGKRSRIGIWKFYYPNGILENLTEYDNKGFLTTMKKYKEDGTLRYTEINSDHQIIETYYYDIGKIETETITEIKTFDEGADKYYSTSKEYYRNGQLKQQKEYVDDILNGDALIWDDKGNLLIQYKYKLGQIVVPDTVNTVID